jgi:hypothetical protein
MKTLTPIIVLTFFLISCQGETSQNEAQENIWKKKTTVDTNIARADADGTTDAPIDGGLSVLLITGALYGAKRMYRNRKPQRGES